MGLFDIFSKKKSNTFNQQVQNTEVNRFGEDLTRLNENGELPWGWVSRKDDFRDKIAGEYSYFFNEWLNSREEEPKKQYATLKSLMLYVNDAQKACKEKGECYEFWFNNIVVSDMWIQDRNNELQNLTQNIDKLQSEYERKIYIENIIAPKLREKLLEIINDNSGILQKDIYKYFDDDVKEYIVFNLYNMEKENVIIREKSGRTYKLTIKE